MDFVSIDVETANPDLSSICQIGIAKFQNGNVVEKWVTLVNPMDYFDLMNVMIHDIDESKVANAPTWPEIHDKAIGFMHGSIVVSHTSFDRSAVLRAADKHGLVHPACTWIDTARVARRAWPQFATKGYGLANLTQTFNIDFQHHNALEDAIACGKIFALAMEKTGLSADQWLERVKAPISPDGAGPIRRSGEEDGPLYGERLVFTGALSLSRSQAADLAANAGCNVDSGVTKKTTMLVVGDQDIRRLAGHQISSKHQKAIDLIKNGQPIRILGESDFLSLVKLR